MADNIARLPYTLQELQNLLLNASPWVLSHSSNHEITIAPDSIGYIDFSDALPDDKTAYEVSLGFWTYSFSGKVSIAFNNCTALISDAPVNGQSINVIIGSDRKLKVGSTSASVTSVRFCIYIQAYRRVTCQTT